MLAPRIGSNVLNPTLVGPQPLDQVRQVDPSLEISARALVKFRSDYLSSWEYQNWAVFSTAKFVELKISR